MIGLVTDSNSQIPADLARRLHVEVVPLTVTVDGVSYIEGVDIDADAFWALFEGATPQVTTAQPSPGRFVEAYEAAARRGADAILSVHIGSDLSGTINTARLAAASAPVPVHIVDTGTASFAVACCVWEAALAVAAGASVEEAAAAAESVAATVGMVFVVKALDLARAGGRLATAAPEAVLKLGADVVPVLTLIGGAMEIVGQVANVEFAADVMADQVRMAGSSLRVGVGLADPATAPLAHALEDRLLEAPGVCDVVRYRVGPSVGAHTGPGTVGAVWYPAGIQGGGVSPTGPR
ncbi:MAG: DegV family protein [Actinomycetota bacterium]|nr:DegV family protein [Actinomycetota bacterium]